MLYASSWGASPRVPEHGRRFLFDAPDLAGPAHFLSGGIGSLDAAAGQD